MSIKRAWIIVVGLAACSDDDSGMESRQTPPQGASQVEAWLAQGTYKSWHCEAAVHEARSPSPHGFNRICSNAVISENADGRGAWPKGAAAVKELYTSLDATTPAGYSVYVKTADDSAGGANWYWYERLPPADAARFGLPAVAADGTGDSGNAKSICVGCHAAAGTDAAHTPSVGGRDQVYTPVL